MHSLSRERDLDDRLREALEFVRRDREMFLHLVEFVESLAIAAAEKHPR